MPIAQSARIHPSAIIAPEADLADDVQVGPFVVIEGGWGPDACCEPAST
jgi:acyl-[acyl carrier protein]--UDP-N-acetylglucosamine O-acyltransferase